MTLGQQTWPSVVVLSGEKISSVKRDFSFCTVLVLPWPVTVWIKCKSIEIVKGVMASALTILHVVLHKVCKITAMFYMLLKDLIKFFADDYLGICQSILFYSVIEYK